MGHVLDLDTFSITTLDNPIPRHLKQFHAFVPDCKLNLRILVSKSALHVIFQNFSNYTECTVFHVHYLNTAQEHFYIHNLEAFAMIVIYQSTKTIHISTQIYMHGIHVYEL